MDKVAEIRKEIDSLSKKKHKELMSYCKDIPFMNLLRENGQIQNFRDYVLSNR